MSGVLMLAKRSNIWINNCILKLSNSDKDTGSIQIVNIKEDDAPLAAAIIKDKGDS